MSKRKLHEWYELYGAMSLLQWNVQRERIMTRLQGYVNFVQSTRTRMSRARSPVRAVPQGSGRPTPGPSLPLNVTVSTCVSVGFYPFSFCLNVFRVLHRAQEHISQLYHYYNYLP